MTRDIDHSTRYVTGNGRDELVPCLAEGETAPYIEYGRSVYNDENLQGHQIKLVIEPGLTHFEKVEISVRIQTIDKATYDFYEQLDGQKLGQYNPFVEPVYIHTNQFGDAAVGYFGSLIRSEPVVFEMPPDD